MPCLWWCWCCLCAGSWWDDAVAVCGKGKGGESLLEAAWICKGQKKSALAVPMPL